MTELVRMCGNAFAVTHHADGVEIRQLDLPFREGAGSGQAATVTPLGARRVEPQR